MSTKLLTQFHFILLYFTGTIVGKKSTPPPSRRSRRRRLICTVENCGYSTPIPKDLARHMRKHTGTIIVQLQLID